jgi:threonine dehydratase
MNGPDLTCPACRRTYAVDSGLMGCPRAKPGEDHNLRRSFDFDPGAGPALRQAWAENPESSFAAFAGLISAGRILGAAGYRRTLARLTARLELLEGRSFKATPLTEAAALAAAAGRTGRLWVKDETGNVTGSHKGRHLMGTLLYIEALRESRRETSKKTLAIYSCGNAALGAAAVARAGGYALHAFVPDEVDPVLAALLAERGAVVERILRPAASTGDPCYLAFRAAVAEKGWVPFACAGTDNWSNIEGGSTLGWELVMQLADRGERIDSVVVQVGGGALARVIAQAFEEALDLGLIAVLPRIHVCQPPGGFPFVRAWILVLAEIARRCGLPWEWRYDRRAEPAAELRRLAAFAGIRGELVRRAAAAACERFDSPAVQALLGEIPGRSRDYMWAWDGPAPHSLAHGILDDLTYDWYWLLRAVLRSGGSAEILGEDAIRSAWNLAPAQTGIPVCTTGAAGLAGLLQLQASGAVDRGEAVGLIFTGFDRARGR